MRPRAEKFNLYTGVKSTYVPFKGTGELVQAVMGKHITVAMSYVPFALQQKGRMRMLAVALDKRHPEFPDVPTFKELGYMKERSKEYLEVAKRMSLVK